MKVYFIGIGGIGMSALAQMLHHDGHLVEGSDREASKTTELLTREGISVHIGQQGTQVPVDADLVIYTEAAWADNVERIRASELGLTQKSYFEALGEFSKGKRVIAVAGTHGKTTTAAMLTHILRDAGADPSAIIGSIVTEFKSNYVRGGSEWLVVEACEYKRDFLTLTPEVLVITNIELDHTDYYKDLADIQHAFNQLAMRTQRVIIADTSSATVAGALTGVPVPVVQYTDEPSYKLSVPGVFNVRNAQAAAAGAKQAAGVSEDMLASSLATFSGTWRRFEYKGTTHTGAQVYDDYAHHPTAISATLKELRNSTPGALYVAFHPHLFSRTRDLFDGFAHAFAGADKVFIAPIYAAREKDDGTMSNTILAEAITRTGTPAVAATFAEIQAAFLEEAHTGDTVVTMGAGDIYKVSDALVR